MACGVAGAQPLEDVADQASAFLLDAERFTEISALTVTQAQQRLTDLVPSLLAPAIGPPAGASTLRATGAMFSSVSCSVAIR